jgi:isoquinoline 1-oxidoreductase
MTAMKDDHLEHELIETVPFAFTPTRRDFMQALGAGLVIAIIASEAMGQRQPGGGRPGGGGGFGAPANAALSSRIHLGVDGVITVLVGKVECGQGSRAELTQGAAEELGVSADQVKLIMSDTGQTPNDGNTAGSGTTPRTLPAIRQAAAAAKGLLIAAAAAKFNIDAAKIQVKEGKAVDAEGKNEFSYADLAKGDEKALAKNLPGNVTLTATKNWKVLGTSVGRPNANEIVTGGHKYPSDIAPAGTLRGKILRPPAYKAKLTALDTAAVKAMKDVVLVQDGAFVGVCAPTSQRAREALEALEAGAKWDIPKMVDSADLFTHLANSARPAANPFAGDFANAAKSLKQQYNIAYAQHAPMEPRAACAQWEDGKLTVWTATQNPFGVKGELTRAFNLGDANCRVIVPDFGGGFGGKHSGECAVECARLAQAAGKPVSLRYTRQEEFMWAYFRPAAVVMAEATLDDKGALTSFHMATVNAGGSGLENPYRVGKNRTQAVAGDPPLRQGSYRALGSTANNFARECFIDELAALAGRDPLEFRLAHLDGRLRGVLAEAAKKFNWTERVKQKDPALGVGLACGTEKGSFVAACVEVAIKENKVSLKRIVQVYDCGTVINPRNLVSQCEGAIIMGLGPALREAMEFKNGAITNGSFADYRVPRFADVPEIECHFINPTDAQPAGAGETPIIAVAPAMANAVFHATGKRLRAMPLKIG